MSKFIPLALLATVATIAVVPSVVFAAETNQQEGTEIAPCDAQLSSPR